MTTGPEGAEPTQPYGAMPPSPSPPPPTGPPAPPPMGAPMGPPTGQPMGRPMGQPATTAAFPGAAWGASPQAPFGVDPRTGIPYSDKQKLVAGLLGIFLGGLGVGRFYIGDTQTGVLQIVVTVFTCGIGHLWGVIDGIIILTKDDAKDAKGYILRPS